MQQLIVLSLVLAVPVALGSYFVFWPKLVLRRRMRLRSQPLADGVDEILKQNVGLYLLLPDDLREQLHGHINVVLHEFAHKLDEENAGTNSQPVLHTAGHYNEWATVLGQEYQSFAGRVVRRKNKVMDEYGLTSPAEFFAVATESFFEKGWSMQRRLPDLYEQLRKFYAVDPASWR